jgi:hypothetical protein
LKKKEKDNYSIDKLFFAGIVFIKNNEDNFRKIVRRTLLLTKAGIDYLLIKVGSEKQKPTKVKKIKIT